MNPDPYADGLKLNISESENEQSLELALEAAPLYRVGAARARQIAAEVVKAVKTWRTLALSLKITAQERDRMEPAFRIADAEA